MSATLMKLFKGPGLVYTYSVRLVARNRIADLTIAAVAEKRRKVVEREMNFS